MPRLFTGLEIPATVGAELALLRGGIPGARWIDPDNYHITLRFLGDVDDRAARDVLEALAEVRRPELALSFDALGWFGGDRPRAIIAKVRPILPLMDLQAEHERLMRRIGLPPDTRNFAPHVTLARLRASSAHAVADYLGSRGAMNVEGFDAARFVLFSARESTGGGPYIVEAAYDLL